MDSKKKSTANVQEFNKFLDNNSEFLTAKYQEYFGNDESTIQNLNKQITINFIYDVFGFTKYQKDPKMNKMLKDSLNQNIKNFSKKILQRDSKNIKKSQKSSTNTQDTILFTSQMSVELLRFCIQNNQMFAVHYDRKEAEKAEAQKQQSNKQQQGKEHKTVQQYGAQNIHQNKKEEQLEQLEQVDQKKPQLENKNQQADDNKASKVSFKQQKNQQNQVDLEQNQFTKNSLQKLSEEQIIKKVEVLFKFYCKQLHSLGGHTTFDRIEHECQCLSLGKFMVFCHATDVFSKYTQLNKKIVIKTFMKVSQGIKQVNLQQFYQLLKKLNDLDPGLFDRLGMNDQSVFKQKKKHLTKPFGTKDTSIRQTKIYGKIQVQPRQNIYTGKRVKDSVRLSISRSRPKNGLQSQIQLKSPQKNQSTRYLKHDENGNTLINPNEVSKLSSAHLEEQVDLGFLNKLINAQDADDQWLGQYKVPLKRSKILINTNKAAISSIRTSRPRQKIDHLSEMPIDQSMHILSGNKIVNRKDNLLLNMKNRIKQLEKTQKRREYTANKRASLSLIQK